MEKKLQDFTETELKALIYDESVRIQISQKNIEVIQAELVNRTKKNDTPTTD